MDLDKANIIKMLGIESLPDDRKLEILNKMTVLVEKRLMARMLTDLNDKQQDELSELMEKNDPAEIQKFVTKHFPHFSEWVEEELHTLKKELAEFAKKHE